MIAGSKAGLASPVNCSRREPATGCRQEGFKSRQSSLAMIRDKRTMTDCKTPWFQPALQ
jgi:hypothetical protein